MKSSISFLLVILLLSSSVLAELPESRMAPISLPENTTSPFLYQSGQALYQQNSAAMSWIHWTSNHIMEGFDGDNFIILGFKPALEYQKTAVEDTQSDLKNIFSAVGKEYQKEGEAYQEISSCCQKKLKGKRLPLLTTQYLKSALKLPFTQNIVDQEIKWISDAFELPSKDKTLKAIWIFTSLGAFLLIEAPLNLISTLLEINYNILSRSLVLATQAFYWAYQGLEFAAQYLNIPIAIIKSLLFQVTMLGMSTLILSWQLVKGTLLLTLQILNLGLVTFIGVSAAGAVWLIDLFQQLQKSVLTIMGQKKLQWTYYLNPLILPKMLSLGTCLIASNDLAKANEVSRLKQDWIEKKITPMQHSQQTLWSQKLLLIPFIKAWFRPENAEKNNGFYLLEDSSGKVNLYWYTPTKSQKIGSIDWTSKNSQLALVVNSDFAALKKFFTKMDSPLWQNQETKADGRSFDLRIQAKALHDYWYLTLAVAEFAWSANALDIDVGLLNQKLNSWKKENPAKALLELTFPYQGFADICLWGQARAGVN